MSRILTSLSLTSAYCLSGKNLLCVVKSLQPLYKTYSLNEGLDIVPSIEALVRNTYSTLAFIYYRYFQIVEIQLPFHVLLQL